MRFPLPANIFPQLIVSKGDEIELQKLAQEYVDDALHEFVQFRDVNNGELDQARWKIIKSHKGMTTYQDLQIHDFDASRTDPKRKVGSGTVITTSTKLHAVLGVGTIEGEFNDMMFGLLNCCTETLKIKSAYTNDCGVDAKVLATIVEPTLSEPTRGMFIKWGLVTVGGSLVKRVVRPRDFVYLESIGIISTESGERIGYSLMHSLQIPSIHELAEYQILRANTSICILFRQKSPNMLELYVKGFVDPMGDVPQSIAVSATADAFLSYIKFVYCGQMKKLNWFVKTKKMVVLDHQNGVCVVCSKPTRRTKCCKVCMNAMCSRCKVTRKLCFLSQRSGRVSLRSMEFCMSCITAALNTDALEIAAEELVRQNPFDVYEMSGSSSPSSKLVSPTDTLPPDTTSEFFG